MSAIALDPLIAEAQERARRRRLLEATLVAVVALGVALAVALPGGAGSRAVHAAGISVRIPQGWFMTRRPFTGITNPVQRLVISSYRVPAAGFNSVGASDYVPSATGVLVDLMEELPATRNPAWQPPGRLRLGRLGGMETFAGRRWAELLIRLRGRHVYAFVWVGRHASALQVQQLLSILNGMRTRSG